MEKNGVGKKRIMYFGNAIACSVFFEILSLREMFFFLYRCTVYYAMSTTDDAMMGCNACFLILFFFCY